jgi:nitronate monooxygenase
MAGVTTPELAAAVTEAGGLGVLAFAAIDVPRMREEMRRARELTSGALGVNLFANPAPDDDDRRAQAASDAIAPLYRELGLEGPPSLSRVGPGFDAERLELVLELGPELASFHFGLPPAEAIARMRARGITVATTATTVAEALAAEEGGADVIIAQGGEAGGHRGTLDPGIEAVGTLALVPQIVDAVTCPVLAAGGIADGRGLAALLALGAVAAQIGTAFIPCPESGVEDDYRRAVLSTAAEDTVMTRAFSGRPARARRNRLITTVGEDAVAAFPIQRQLSGPLAKGGPEYRAFWMGQAAALSKEEPAGVVLDRIVGEARSVALNVADRWRDP